jgi:hypothetical protein
LIFGTVEPNVNANSQTLPMVEDEPSPTPAEVDLGCEVFEQAPRCRAVEALQLGNDPEPPSRPVARTGEEGCVGFPRGP